jgi:ketosteroid isomerase-like protein
MLDVVAADAQVAVRFRSRSTLPGRGFDMTIADFFEVRDGLIVRDHTIFNAERSCR